MLSCVLERVFAVGLRVWKVGVSTTRGKICGVGVAGPSVRNVRAHMLGGLPGLVWLAWV